MVVAVTRPDKRRARGSAPTPTPLKALALKHGIPVVYNPADCLSYGADLGVVVAYGRIISAEVLAELEMINVHFSLLPRWRGAAPVERAILAGDESTGVCVMRVEEGLDTGGVYCSAETPIEADESASCLTRRLAALGATLLVDALDGGLGVAQPQQGEATYAAKIGPDDLRMDWSRRAVELQRIVRLGRAWTVWRNQRVLVLSSKLVAGQGVPGTIGKDCVFTGDGAMQLLEVQPQGKRSMDGASWLRGVRPLAGESFEWPRAGEGG